MDLYYSQQLDPVAQRYSPCLRAIVATTLLVKATKKIFVGYLLTTFVPHAVESLLSSHHTQNFSANHLTSCEILLLTVPHIILLHCNNLNPATLLSITNKALHDCLLLMGHLLSPCNDLQEIPLGKVTSHGSLVVLI